MKKPSIGVHNFPNVSRAAAPARSDISNPKNVAIATDKYRIPRITAPAFKRVCRFAMAALMAAVKGPAAAVKSIASYVHINDIVKVKVIDFDHSSNHAKLSLKAVDNRFRRKDKKLVYKNPRKPIVETPKGFLPLAQAMEEWLKQGVMEEN